MELVGQIALKAPRMVVWDALNNPQILAGCIQGCTELIRESDTQFAGKVEAKVGPVKASFQGIVTLSDIIIGKSYTISGEGKGGVAGFAKGQAEVNLQDSSEGTLLEYRVKANVGGKLAQLGSRLIDAAAKSYADSFFNAFRKLVEQPDEGSQEGALEHSEQSDSHTKRAVPHAEMHASAPSTTDMNKQHALETTGSRQKWLVLWLAILVVFGFAAIFWLQQ
jgi:carbon monoxide dehydrogenase subunit G